MRAFVIGWRYVWSGISVLAHVHANNTDGVFMRVFMRVVACTGWLQTSGRRAGGQASSEAGGHTSRRPGGQTSGQARHQQYLANGADDLALVGTCSLPIDRNLDFGVTLHALFL